MFVFIPAQRYCGMLKGSEYAELLAQFGKTARSILLISKSR